MWVAYGVLKQAPPVVAANLLVFGAAAWTARRSRGEAVAPARDAPLPAEIDA